MTGNINPNQWNFIEFLIKNPIVIVAIIAMIVMKYIVSKDINELNKLTEEQKKEYRKQNKKNIILYVMSVLVAWLFIGFGNKLGDVFNSELYDKLVEYNYEIYVWILIILLNCTYSYYCTKKYVKSLNDK